jgi:hypothetical protein
MNTPGTIGNKLADLEIGTDNRVLLSEDVHSSGVTVDTVLTVTTVSDGVTVSAGSITDIAEEVLGKNIDDVEGTGHKKSLFGLVAYFFNKSTLASSTITVYKTDGVTVLLTQAVTQSSVNPITSKNEIA